MGLTEFGESEGEGGVQTSYDFHISFLSNEWANGEAIPPGLPL